MKKGIGYIRVSTKKQEESPEAQEKMIRAYCQLQDIDLIKIIYDVGVSGEVPILKRPGASELSDFIGAGVNNIISTKLDRMFRNTIDALTQIAAWQEQNIAVHIINMQGISLDTSTANGKFFLTMLAAVAEMERSLIQQRTQEAMDNKRDKGEYLGGKVPFGFQHVNWFLTSEGKKVGGILQELPNRRAIVKDIKDMHTANLSSRFIAKAILDDHGVSISHATVLELAKEPDEQIDFVKEGV